jgi:hypothetical protein
LFSFHKGYPQVCKFPFLLFYAVAVHKSAVKVKPMRTVKRLAIRWKFDPKLFPKGQFLKKELLAD